METTETLDTNIRTRVFAAADQLYEQNGRTDFPSVADVRKVAKVAMNDASALMKEWRRSQTVQATPVAVTVPEIVTQAHNQALASLWTQAQELANESLRIAQTAWDAERHELDAMRQELSDAYEVQALEYEQFKSQNEAALSVSKDALKKAVNDLELMRGELAQAVTRAERAEAKISEIEHRVSDLRSELERAHQDADAARTALAEQKQVHQAIADDLNQTKKELVKAHSAAQVQAETYREQRESMQAIIAEFDQVKSELIKTREQRETAIQNASRQNALFDKALSERDFAISESNKAREEAAELRGQIDAVKEQNEKLLDAIRK